MNAGVDADAPFERVEVLAEATPTSTARPARARRGACPRPGPSCAACSRRPPSCSGASPNEQLPPMTDVTPWTFDGVAGRDPRTAGRRSACADRRTRDTRRARRRRASRAPARRRGPPRRPGRRGRRRRRSTPGAPVPSTTVAPLMQVVEHGDLLCVSARWRCRPTSRARRRWDRARDAQDRRSASWRGVPELVRLPVREGGVVRVTVAQRTPPTRRARGRASWARTAAAPVTGGRRGT